MSGTAVKVAFKAITTFAPGYYQETVHGMVPDMVNQLAPFWADFQVSGGGDFGDYLSKRSDEVCPALLVVTDDMRDRSGRATVVRAYKRGARRRQQAHRGSAAEPRRDDPEVRLTGRQARHGDKRRGSPW